MKNAFLPKRPAFSLTLMMPSVVIAALLAFFAQQPTPVSVEQTPTTTTTANNTAFQVGEELVYKLYYNLNFVWIPAGEVTFKVEDSGTQYHLLAVGRTYSSYEWFYKVRDRYDTYLDKQTLLPTLSQRILNEGKYQLYDRVIFNQTNLTGNYERGNDPKNVDKRGTLSFKTQMHDILSIIYAVRTNDFNKMKKGDDFPVNVLLDEEHHALKVEMQGKEVKNVKDNGKYSTIRLSPQLVSGEVFKEGSRMHLWATDDQNHVPMLIESPVSVGSVKVVLKSAKGLRTALVGAK